MRLSNIALSTLATVVPLAAAIGNAVVENQCDDPVYLWSVGSTMGDEQTIDPGESYSEPFRLDDTTGGISLKITRNEGGLFDGSPQLNYAYALADEKTRVFYDLSSVFGEAFEGDPLLVKPSDENCGEISWPDGVSPKGSQVNDCGSDGDVTLFLCAEE